MQVQWRPMNGRCHSRSGAPCVRKQFHVRALMTDKVSPVQLSTVVSKYQGVLLDQFGVLHDGRQPYPGAISAVRQLAEAGLKILIVSNSSRRSSGTLGRLAAMGFQEEWFAGAVTSGELTHRYLLDRPSEWWRGLGSRCVHITWGQRGAVDISQLNLQIVDDPSQAEVIVVHGTQALALPTGGIQTVSLDEIRALLERCAAAPSPPTMIVANPDLVTVDGDSLAIMPGTLAQVYCEAGGPVQLMGKPDPVIYQAASEMLMIPTEKLLAIGDSLEHDIAGASSVGVDSLFIAGGIHAAELQVTPQQLQQDDSALHALCLKYGTCPTYILPYLTW